MIALRILGLLRLLEFDEAGQLRKVILNKAALYVRELFKSQFFPLEQ
jgi:hypothetical protein